MSVVEIPKQFKVAERISIQGRIDIYDWSIEDKVKPFISFRTIEKTWDGDLGYGYSFDYDGNFWFWIRVGSNHFKLYKLTLSTNDVEEMVDWNTLTDASTITNMIITSENKIYSLIKLNSLTGAYNRILVHCGDISNPTTPDTNDCIWSTINFDPWVRLYDVFIDENDDIYGYAYGDDCFIKRTGISTYEITQGFSTWYTPYYSIGGNVKVGSSIYSKGYDSFIKYKDLSNSSIAVDYLLNLPETLYLDTTRLCYNPVDGKIYIILEDNIFYGTPLYKEFLCLLYLNPLYL